MTAARTAAPAVQPAAPLPAYGTDSAHDRRVHARLAELAALRGCTLEEVLQQLNTDLDAGRTPVPEPPAQPHPEPAPRGAGARAVAQRPADDTWAVTGVAHDGPPAAPRRPCGGEEPCPWRRDAPPGQFPAQAFVHSAPGNRTGAPTGRFGCHSSTPRVDGDTVNIGAWLAKARTKRRAGQLPEAHAQLLAVLFDGDWTTEDATPAALA
ncbi:DUF6283 family protein [Streptomyces sp. NPDC006527]|uniref:DUF6283 family protein n=1 Tax=Streptomyces sp. NPDC006527 TaxID=3364749 RepID=UPI00369B1BFB